MRAKKLGSILFVVDERLSRERGTQLARTIHALRQFAEVHLVAGSATEDEVLKKLEEKMPQLVLAPWYRYLAWSRVEAFYGLTRTNGPTFAGYFCEQLLAYELGEQADHLRAILLDFSDSSNTEIALVVKSLIQDRRRAGLLPLLDPGTRIYCESWYVGQGLGTRMDRVLALPEVAGTDWIKRSNEIRILLNSLWALIFEEGPGKTDFHQQITQTSPKAYFQVAADRHAVSLRLCYNLVGISPKDVLALFWPKRELPRTPAQLLIGYADFLRVHWIAENNDIEIVAGLLATPVNERQGGQLRHLWVEPLAASMVSEVPYEAPNPNSPHLKLLPGATTPEARPRMEATPDMAAKDRFIQDASLKIRELKKMVTERDERIFELRAGGVGTAPPLPPPDAEALLDAFQERFFDARFQIRQFELQIVEMEKKGATPQDIETLRQKMSALANREQAWIRKLASTIEAYRNQRGGS